MEKAETYRALATLLEYPEDRDAVLASLEQLQRYLDHHGMESSPSPLADLVRESALSELQEDYVASFDFNPALAPYLGHHLYGDNQKRAAYMIMLKQQYSRYEYQPEGCELPDHLSVLARFLSHLSERSEHQPRREFIQQSVLPALNLLISAQKTKPSHWLPLFESAALLMSSDCEEVSSC